MSNRQARREQARTTRTTRTTRPQQSPRKPTGGGGSSIFTGGFMLVLAGFAVLAVIGIILVIIFGGGSSSSNSDLVTALEKHNTEFPAELAKGNKVGKDDAPVKITAYEDFQCPFCLKYTATQEGDVINELVKTGKVQLEYRPFYFLQDFGDYSERAANALRFTSKDLLGFGVVDDVIEEPLGGAHRDHHQIAARMKLYLLRMLRGLRAQPLDKLLDARYAKFRKMGMYAESAAT